MATILYRFLTFDIWMIVLLCWFHTLRRKCAADSHAGAMKEKNTGRMEKSFEATQQEEHQFQTKTNRTTFFDCHRSFAEDFDCKCASLDSKAFGKVDWNALWSAFGQH